jgi:glycosyltransferase involved in cell wall biosynthesis
MKKLKLGIVNSSPLSKSYGGVTPFTKNLDPFLREAFDLSYIHLPDFLHDIRFVPRRLVFGLYLLLKRRRLNRFDMILSHVPEGSYMVSFGKAPFIHVFHGNSNPMLKSRYWYGRYFAALFDSMEKRVVKKATLMYTVGVESPGVAKIFNPILHTVAVKPAAERSGFIHAGRVEKGKHIDKLIRLYAKLPVAVQEENPLYIAGMGTQEKVLKELAASTPMAGKVIFLGNLSNDELIEVDSTKKILLMASSQEGFPMAIAEAFSLGVPVVSTDPGDIPRFLKSNENGFLLPIEFDEAEYIRSILTILGDYDRFSKNALASAAVFKAEEVARHLIQDIQQVISK